MEYYCSISENVQVQINIYMAQVGMQTYKQQLFRRFLPPWSSCNSVGEVVLAFTVAPVRDLKWKTNRCPAIITKNGACSTGCWVGHSKEQLNIIISDNMDHCLRLLEPHVSAGGGGVLSSDGRHDSARQPSSVVTTRAPSFERPTPAPHERPLIWTAWGEGKGQVDLCQSMKQS